MPSDCGAEKTPESSLDNTEIKLVNLKGSQPWILFWRTDAEAEAPVFWSPDVNSQLTEKFPDAGEDWGQKEKSVSKDEMAEWYHWCNGHELGKTFGDGEVQGGAGVLQFMGSQRVRHAWVTEQQQPGFPNTLYWRHYLLPIEYSCLICHELIDCICLGLSPAIYSVPLIYVSISVPVPQFLILALKFYSII